MTNTPNKGRWAGTTPLSRLTNGIDYSTASGCWNWTKSLSDTGYGRIYRDGRTDYTHRLMFELYYGPIPEGLHIDHLCRNTRCCNPEHLEPVTPDENRRRGVAPSAVSQRTNRCRRGHEFTPENTYRRPDGTGRMCATCQSERTAERSAARSAKRAAVRAAKKAAGIPLRPDLRRNEKGQFVVAA